MLNILKINNIKYKIKMLDIEEFSTKLNKNSRLMGIDPGKKRIGIALSDENRRIATPHKTIIKNNFTSFIEEIKKIIDEYNIQGIVIGNPINLDGSDSRSSQSAKDLAINLSKNISKPITMWDESFSSEGAFNLASNLDVNTSKKIKKLDENAAAFILQGVLDFLKK